MRPLRYFAGLAARGIRAASQGLARVSASLDSQTTGAYGGFFGDTLAGVTVTPQGALSLTSVYAAINVISRDIATLPRVVYAKTGRGGKRRDTSKTQHRLVNTAPNAETSAVRFYQALAGHVLGWGNGFAEIVRDEWTGDPAALYLLHPSSTTTIRDDNKRLFYKLSNGKLLTPENVIHIAGLGFDGINGYSPVRMAMNSLGLSIATERFGAAWFGNGSRPGGWIKLKKKLTPEAKDGIRESITSRHGGPDKAHQIGFLEEDMEFTPSAVPPEEAQFILTREFQVVEVARLYNLPPHKIGDYSKSHLANVEEANLDYLSTTLTGWLEIFEAELDRKLFTAADREQWFIEHDMSRLMRGNMAARVAYYGGMRGNGAMNADEIREREGMNPIGKRRGGDKYLVQSALTTLEAIGNPPAASTSSDPSQPPPTDQVDQGAAEDVTTDPALEPSTPPTGDPTE